MFLPHPEKGTLFSITSLGLASSLQQSLRKEASGAMRFSTSFATAWFCAACSGAHFGDPHSDFCLTPLQTRSRRRTQLAHGSVTPSWHGGTGHTSAFALGDWGVGPTPSGGRSHGQGMLRKIHSGGFRAYPMKAQCFPVGHATQAELRSSLPQEAGLGTAP